MQSVQDNTANDIAGYNFTEKGNPSKPLLKESKAFDSGQTRIVQTDT